MVALFVEQAVALLLLAQLGITISVIEEDKSYKYEEYVVEHEISSGQAKNSVLSANVNSSRLLFITLLGHLLYYYSSEFLDNFSNNTKNFWILYSSAQVCRFFLHMIVWK